MKHLSIALLCVLVSLTSCHKADNEDPLPGTPKIKNIVHYKANIISTEDYEYDGLGRLLKLTYTNGYINYKYYSNKIIMTTVPTDDVKRIDTLLLNDQGLVKAQSFGDIIHEYEADGILDKSIFHNPGGEQRMVYDYKSSDGNTSGYEIWNLEASDPQLLFTYDFEYLLNTVNTIGNENKGMPFLGKQDKNLLWVSTRKTYHITTDPLIEKYRYEWDRHKRVVKRWDENYPQNYDLYEYYQ